MDHDVDEVEAIRRCQQAATDALEALVERYRAHAIRLAYLLTGDRALAEDIAQGPWTFDLPLHP